MTFDASAQMLAPPRGDGKLRAPKQSLKEMDGQARRRRRRDRRFSRLLTVAMALAVIPLALIVYRVTYEGYRVLTLTFFTQDTIPFRRVGGGFRQGFFGTFYIMVIAIALAVPMGVAAAVYLVEYGRGKLGTAVRFFTDVMTGVPSIFVGLFVYAVLVVGTVEIGFGTLAGAVAIAIIMVPMVVRASEEMLKMVPDALRNASAGLGARRWHTATRVVLPAAAPGLVTSAILAIARGVGETAPLLLTAFGSLTLVTSLTEERQAALPLLINDNANQPFPPGVERAWGGALSLLVLTLVFTIGARIVGNRLAIREVR